METWLQDSRPTYMFVVVEDPDGYTFHQRIDNDFDALLEFKKSLGKGYWICDIYDP